MCTCISNGKLYYTLTIAQFLVPVCYFEAKGVVVSTAGGVVVGVFGLCYYSSTIFKCFI